MNGVTPIIVLLTDNEEAPCCGTRYQLLGTEYFKKKDPDDNKFVDCAISAGADYIVSEDAHFRILETIPFPTVYVIRLDDFLKEMD